MLPEIWEPNQTVVFVGAFVDELSDILGFYYLQPRNRFWELLELGGITPTRIISKQESKALADGHRQGSLSDPIRLVFIEKKTSQLLRLGVGLTTFNRRTLARDDKDKSADPTEDDVRHFIARVDKMKPRFIGFVVDPETFVELFKSRYPDVAAVPGPQSFRIGASEVWFLGPTRGKPRGEALEKQEDAFFALGEAVQASREKKSAS